MIQAIANRMAGFVVKNDDTADFEVLSYGFGLIVSGVFTYTAVIASALLFGVIKEMLIAISVYVAMRLTIGGVHAGTRLICFITYLTSLYLCIFLSFTLHFTSMAIVLWYLIDITLLILYAPGDTEAQPIVKRRLTRKILGITFLSFFFALFVFFSRGMQVEANLLLLVPTLTCVLLHPVVYRMFGCRKSNSKQ